MKPINDTDKWEMPKELRITNPKIAAESAEFQKDMAARTASPLAHAGPQQVEMARASRMIEHLSKDFDRIRVQPSTPELEQTKESLLMRIAEAHATLGNYDVAAILEPRPEQRRVYREIQEAIDKDDSVWCRCPVGRDFVRQEVFSLKHGRKMPLRACGGCKTLNVADLPEHLARRASHEERARQAVAGLSPKDAAAKLRAMNHTSKQLLDI